MGKRGLKADKTGRTKSGDKFARVFLKTMQSPAWRALSPHAQRLYPWLLLEWTGSKENNNGRISLSVRQAADLLGSHTETARRAFLDLQAKGFLVVTRCAALGTAGEARRHLYEITELGTAAQPVPRKLFRDWKPGCDFPVVRAKASNPSGKGGFENLEPQPTTPGRNPRPQPTEGYTPNLRRRTNEAKNDHFPTYAIGHPYLPEGVGRRHTSRPADPSATFDGGMVRFAVVRGGVPIRVGVRTHRRGAAVIGGRS